MGSLFGGAMLVICPAGLTVIVVPSEVETRSPLPS